MTEAALVGYLVLVVLAFGVRTVLHLRRTGDHGWLPAHNWVGAVGDGSFTLGITAALAGPALALAGVIGERDSPTIIGVVGIALVYGGAVFALAAQAQMGEAWRAGVDVHATSPLVVGGLYRVCRNPFYLGMITATAGVALTVPHIITALALLLVGAGSYIDARFLEEPALLRGHGDSYARYRDSTPRLLPRPWRLTRGPTLEGPPRRIEPDR